MRDDVFDLLTTPWKTSVLTAAVRLRIFTVLADRLMSAEEIAYHTQTLPHLLKHLLDACAGMGLLAPEEDRYRNTALSSAYLMEGKPDYIGDFIELMHNESQRWANLTALARGGGPFSDVPTAEEAHRTFIKGMHNLAMAGEAAALLRTVDLSGCRHMVDAGGGSGAYSTALCRAYPDLQSTILDRPETLAVTRELMAHHPERKRISLRECDIETEALGDCIDAVLLSDVVYDAPKARAVLKNAWECLADGGVLIVRGYYRDSAHGDRLFGALFALNQLVFDPGRTLVTVPLLRDMLDEIGFSVTTISPLTELSFVIVASKCRGLTGHGE